MSNEIDLSGSKIPDPDEIIISKMQRNDYASDSQSFTVTLPFRTFSMIATFASARNMTISKAINNLAWWGYHADRGDYEPPVKKSK